MRNRNLHTYRDVIGGNSELFLVTVGLASVLFIGFACSGILMIVLGVMLSLFFGLHHYYRWQFFL